MPYILGHLLRLIFYTLLLSSVLTIYLVNGQIGAEPEFGPSPPSDSNANAGPQEVKESELNSVQGQAMEPEQQRYPPQAPSVGGQGRNRVFLRDLISMIPFSSELPGSSSSSERGEFPQKLIAVLQEVNSSGEVEKTSICYWSVNDYFNMAWELIWVREKKLFLSEQEKKQRHSGMER